MGLVNLDEAALSDRASVCPSLSPSVGDAFFFRPTRSDLCCVYGLVNLVETGLSERVCVCLVCLSLVCTSLGGPSVTLALSGLLAAVLPSVPNALAFMCD